jgi:hypothetical protein
MIQHAVGLLLHPESQWRSIASLPDSTFRNLTLFPVIFALLPAIAWYYGAAVVGWSVGNSEEIIRLTADSAMQISILFYFAMVISIGVIGYFIHWMADTYGADSTITKGLVIAGLTASPLFLSGLVGFYPVLWIDMLVGVAAISWSVYLLYLGIPIVMGIPEERGFLFSSAVVAIGLVMFIVILVATVILWDFGAAPAFTD